MSRGAFRPLVLSSKAKAAPCPTCHTPLDGVTGTEIDARTRRATGKRPRPGDITLCVYCKTFLVFTSEMMLRLATQAEIDTLSPEARALYAHAIREL